MVRPRTSPETTPILQLLSDYSFDVDTYAAEAMVTGWLQQFEPAWVSQAITEALYQGRYKMVSVDHILQLWQRRGQPLRHFNREFESIILGQSWGQLLAATKANAKEAKATLEDPSAVLSSDLQGSAKVAAIPQGHLTSGHLTSGHLTSAEAQGREYPLSAPTIGATPSQTTHKPHQLHKGTDDPSLPSAPAPLPAEASPPDSAWEESALFGGSARTIPPLTSDQLARLTQPAIAPTLATTHQNHRVDDGSLQSLTDENVEAESPKATGATEATTTAEAVMLEAADPVEDDTTDRRTATAATAQPLAPEQALALGESPTAQVAIPNFQPVADLASHPESTDSIPPFVPNPGPSDFHQRLKAVVEAGRQDN